MHPQALPAPLEDSPLALNVPAPSKLKDLKISSAPIPSGKICALSVPERSPAVVNCMINTRWFSASATPFGAPLVTYQAPPYQSSIAKSWPLIPEVELNAPTHGWKLLSTVLAATCDPLTWLEVPMVTQLSYSNDGNSGKNAGLIPSAVAPVANVSL